jgi:septal ring factor EnvC (AmiA/AmiB activator)
LSPSHPFHSRLFCHYYFVISNASLEQLNDKLREQQRLLQQQQDEIKRQQELVTLQQKELLVKQKEQQETVEKEKAATALKDIHSILNFVGVLETRLGYI